MEIIIFHTQGMNEVSRKGMDTNIIENNNIRLSYSFENNDISLEVSLIIKVHKIENRNLWNA